MTHDDRRSLLHLDIQHEMRAAHALRSRYIKALVRRFARAIRLRVAAAAITSAASLRARRKSVHAASVRNEVRPNYTSIVWAGHSIGRTQPAAPAEPAAPRRP